MTLTAAQRVLRARAGGLSTAARGHVNTAPARDAFLAKFLAQVDPDGTLGPVERARRCEAARRLHFTRLALRSSVTTLEEEGRSIVMTEGAIDRAGLDALLVAGESEREMLTIIAETIGGHAA
jgi:hypothetical protein